MIGSGNWGGQWSADEVAQLRSALGLNKVSFAERLEVHRRTARRWEQGDTAATDHRVITALDDLLCETICQVAPWLTPVQVRQMQRRDVLRMLGTGALTVLPELQFRIPNITSLSEATLEGLSTTTANLASGFYTVPRTALLVPTVAHFDASSRLLKASMLPNQRQRLQIILADLAAFAAVLYFTCDKHGQARAHFDSAKSYAFEAGNMVMLAQVLASESLLYSTVPNGGQEGDPNTALRLTEEADELARRYAPAIAQTWVSLRLAEERAVAGDAWGTDEALERAENALQKAQDEGPVGSGYFSSAGRYCVWGEEHLAGFRGACEVLLKRPERAMLTLQSALGGDESPHRHAAALTDLGAALLQRKEPKEVTNRLITAHEISCEHSNVMGLQRIYGVRAQFPESFADLACVRELDERLGWSERLAALSWRT